MAVPSTKLILLNPIIITDHQIDTEGRISICRDHGAALALDALGSIQLCAFAASKIGSGSAELLNLFSTQETGDVANRQHH